MYTAYPYEYVSTIPANEWDFNTTKKYTEMQKKGLHMFQYRPPTEVKQWTTVNHLCDTLCAVYESPTSETEVPEVIFMVPGK